MKIISSIQNTDDWYKLRNTRLGASDANIIMGLSKFKTPLELWKQKTGEPEKGNKEPNFIQAKGHRLEEKCRPIAEMVFDTEFPSMVALSSTHEFLMASLDGYSAQKNWNWENKFVGKEDFEKVSKGIMLEHYKPQIQQQLMITGAEKCVLFVIRDNKESKNPNFPYEYCYMFVEPDREYMVNELLPAMIDFWDNVENKVSPELSINDVVNMDDNQKMLTLLLDYKDTKETSDAFIKKEKALKIKIFILSKDAKVTCNGIKISSSLSDDKEVFDHALYVEQMGVPDGFWKTQKGRKTQRITFPK